MMRVLVIGASGFIGLHVVDQLLGRGISVRATVRKSTPTLWLRRRSIELVPGSLEEPAALRAAMRGCDAVILAGAHYPRYSLDLEGSLHTGVTGVRNACEAALAAGVSRFVYTSSIATLAAAAHGPSNEDDVACGLPQHSVYRAVKWAMEREVEEAAARGLRAVTLLVGGCVGSGDVRAGTTGLMIMAVRGELPFSLDGVVNLVDVEDAARAHVAALSAPGDRYCIAPHNLRFTALLEWIVARYGGQVPARVDVETAIQLADAAEHDAAARKARVPFPRELVDVIANGHPVVCERAMAELSLCFSPIEPAFDRTHAFFARAGFLPRRPPQERHSA